MSQSDALTHGKVERVHSVQPISTPMAHAACLLRAEYSADAHGTLPAKLFFKIGRRISAVNFQQYIASRTTDLPVVPCHYARFANELGQSNLLYDDISETHAPPPSILPTDKPTTLRFVEILASLHRQWWEHPDLGRDSTYAEILDDLPNFVLNQVVPQFASFVDRLGDRLSDRRRRWYERVLATLPHPLWCARMTEHHAVTLVHGDAHFENFLLPKQSADSILLIDWELWHVNLSTYDLSYMLALRMFPERRARIEQDILRHYHAHLNIPGYSWQDLMDDYRLAVVYQTIWPIFWHRFVANEVWWQFLEDIMSAFQDLGCEELV